MAVVISVVGAYNGREIARAQSDLARLQKATAAAGAGMSSAMANAGRSVTTAGQKISGAGMALTRNLSLPLLAIGGYAVKTQMDFESSMNTLAEAADLPAKDVERLSELAKKMGADTVFSAGQAADAMVELAKAGIKPAQIEAGALKATMSVAATEGLELADAATIVSNAMSTFKINGDQAVTVADALAGGSKASTASVASLSMALSQVGVGAATAGLSIQDTVAVLAAFDKAGIKGSDAGTSLKTMLTRLIPSTDAAKGAMRKLGLSFTDAKGEFLPMEEIAGRLQKAMGKLSDKERTLAMNTIFGSDATRAATVLMQEGEAGIRDFIKATSEQGAAQRLADARMKGTAGAIEAMKGSVETAALALGEALAPTVLAVSKGIATAANWFSKLDAGTQQWVATIGMALVALGPVIYVLGKFTSGIGRTITGVAKLSRGIYKASGPLRAFASGLKQPQSGLSAFASRSQRAGAAVTRAMQATAKASWSALKDLARNTVAAGKTIASALARAAATSVAALKSMARAAVSAGIAIGKAMWKAALAVGRAMVAIGRAMLANPWALAIAAVILLVVLIVKNWDKVKAVTKAVWGWIREFMGDVWGKIKGVVTGAVNAIRTVIMTYFNIYKTIITTYVKAWLFVITTVWNAIKLVIRGAVAAVKATIEGLASIPGRVAGFFVRAKDGAVRVLSALVDYVKGIPGRIVAALGNLGSLLYNAGQQVIQGFIDGLKSMWGKVQGGLTALKDKLTGWKGPPREDARILTNAGQLVIEGFIRGINSRAAAVRDALGGITSTIAATSTQMSGALRVSADYSGMPSLAGASPRTSPRTARSVVVGTGAVQVALTVGADADGPMVTAAVEAGVGRALRDLVREIQAA